MSNEVSEPADELTQLETAEKRYDMAMTIICHAEISGSQCGKVYEVLTFLKTMRDGIRSKIESLKPKEDNFKIGN